MLRRIVRFVAQDKGTALVEFALVLPVMITLFMGLFEVTRVVSAYMKLANAANTIASMVAQQTSVSHTTTTSIPDFCNGGKLSMTPLTTASLTANIVSVTNYTSGGRKVDWNDTTCGGSAMSSATAISLATSVTPSTGDSTIIVQANYAYASTLTYVLKSAYTLTVTAYARPRAVTSPPIPYS